MLARMAIELGPWVWWILGLLLLAAELALPGVFLVWIGIGALATGILSLALWETTYWTWQVQLLVFAALAVVATFVGRRYLARSDETATDEPLLNQRAASLAGRTATLQEPIVNGRGRIRLDDTFWPVKGPDLPVGTTVRVVETGTGAPLTVEQIS